MSLGSNDDGYSSPHQLMDEFWGATSVEKHQPEARRREAKTATCLLIAVLPQIRQRCGGNSLEKIQRYAGCYPARESAETSGGQIKDTLRGGFCYL